ncbi:bis(5'-nucleosyl)-tetraphosphatase (symmetrical) YqeK [Alteribacter natronophilus]|uniref:bis(5'-nucleosyl)-tetraphosphatase (symmetrical) YqeK n=1 Tax=Alteribacter natronophilus TaxID=2583810 RepID=UPI00110D2C8D|nr:bis(5'-nucleosyl)-tetraphosphatase (symmetrical) YqeK [Alteribacter natronophilus]TMW70987.1 HD domain-containing protein [Alteribacter natronophilus]
MKSIFEEYTAGFQLTGDTVRDTVTFLKHNGFLDTAEHSMRVAEETVRIAKMYQGNEEAAEAAGYLHDISVVIPNRERAPVAERLGLEVLDAERQFPLIIHQKISRYMAREIFNVDDEEILSAIECHTTLKKNASQTDKIVFTADKVEWDQPHKAPYLDEVKKGLAVSVDRAAFAYLDYMWQRRKQLRVVHPWLEEAHSELAGTVFLQRGRGNDCELSWKW